ncbi:isocitrate lyase/phosphoenolpyruvate mutase family protein [Companilactobacillus sp.]|uniref:isocitrate lyase/phosphoenolpyruvate mutase family protein n=1 Tax=Companilactobacillus sp. TaxID=2767905 RepID=UPI0026188CF7|nr:isocitrate lyase/phosphoenolpyruvate mutase family protein [Companilactobacillus sp.]
MSAHFIPAASNALMVKHLESAGFNSVYLDRCLLSTQLLGTLDAELLSNQAYLNYVQHLTTVSDMNVIADAYVSDGSDSLRAQVTALQKAGCNAVVVNDADFADTKTFENALNTLNQATDDDDFTVIAKLDGFVKYGLNELQDRINIAKLNGIDQIIISSITNDDLVIIKAVINTAVISLIIDNAKITYFDAQQLDPEFILDTYHVYQGLNQAAKMISHNMIIKIFMG